MKQNGRLKTVQLLVRTSSCLVEVVGSNPIIAANAGMVE